MNILIDKITKNIKNGTLLTNGLKALKNRFVKKIKHSNLIYWLDKNRVRTKIYLESIPLIGKNQIKVGNYYLDRRISIDSDSIIYSLGILNDIEFDLAVANLFNANIFMYDPTPLSIEFMTKYTDNPNFNFFPYGVWIENKEIKFYEPVFGGSSSAFKNKNSDLDKYFVASCFTVNTLMKKNKHNQIDVFKADIEGAALPILEQMIQEDILPTQIVVEFERPSNSEIIDDFFLKVDSIRKQLKLKSYEEYQIPRGSGKYFSMEFLFVRIQTLKPMI